MLNSGVFDLDRLDQDYTTAQPFFTLSLKKRRLAGVTQKRWHPQVERRSGTVPIIKDVVIRSSNTNGYYDRIKFQVRLCPRMHSVLLHSTIIQHYNRDLYTTLAKQLFQVTVL